MSSFNSIFKMKALFTKVNNYFARNFHASGRELFSVLNARAIESSADFIERNSDHATNFFGDHWEMRANTLKNVLGSGLLLEFGVNRGNSANFFSNILDQRSDSRQYFGFDTFTGLTEDWGGVALAGTFNRDGVPPLLNKRVTIVNGDILETLSTFLAKNEESIAFIHIDTDTYTPCQHVLKLCKDRLVNGSIILFDELLGYPNYQSHELKALTECIPRESYRYLSFGIAHPRAKLIKSAIEITDAQLLNQSAP